MAQTKKDKHTEGEGSSGLASNTAPEGDGERAQNSPVKCKVAGAELHTPPSKRARGEEDVTPAKDPPPRRVRRKCSQEARKPQGEVVLWVWSINQTLTLNPMALRPKPQINAGHLGQPQCSSNSGIFGLKHSLALLGEHEFPSSVA